MSGDNQNNIRFKTVRSFWETEQEREREKKRIYGR